MNKPSPYIVLVVSICFALVACGGEGQQATRQEPASVSTTASTPEPAPEPEAPSIEIAAATPEEAYETFKKIIEAGDLDAYKSMMSSGLAQRLQGDFLINDAMKSTKTKGWFERVPMTEPTMGEDRASFSKSADVDDGKMVATYSIVFVLEEGVWKFETLDTATRFK